MKKETTEDVEPGRGTTHNGVWMGCKYWQGQSEDSEGLKNNLDPKMVFESEL